ncbi:Uu.00g122570.m01.CDS01 [Anthostomella pinea]|uniref:Uu.00g122570.m01.CDS01 n=1 Tax=Anthostomella pinea TaxID=933095 RepID=A0AAI8VH94_9PEZI|nr:Uu.00g122570.m01.CDS01 [Anthostomella pinea]
MKSIAATTIPALAMLFFSSPTVASPVDRSHPIPRAQTYGDNDYARICTDDSLDNSTDGDNFCTIAWFIPDQCKNMDDPMNDSITALDARGFDCAFFRDIDYKGGSFSTTGQILNLKNKHKNDDPNDVDFNDVISSMSCSYVS